MVQVFNQINYSETEHALMYEKSGLMYQYILNELAFILDLALFLSLQQSLSILILKTQC